jgi:outer membrane protein assembly factor BamB
VDHVLCTRPVLEQGVVYTSDTAVQATTGQVLWRQPAIDGSCWDDVDCFRPGMTQGLVFVNTFGALAGLEASTGRIRWTFPTADQEERYETSPLAANGLVYFGTHAGNFYAARQDSGKQVWVAQLQRTVNTDAVLIDGYVVVGAGALFACDPATGKLQWKYACGQIMHALTAG